MDVEVNEKFTTSCIHTFQLFFLLFSAFNLLKLPQKITNRKRYTVIFSSKVTIQKNCCMSGREHKSCLPDTLDKLGHLEVTTNVYTTGQPKCLSSTKHAVPPTSCNLPGKTPLFLGSSPPSFCDSHMYMLQWVCFASASRFLCVASPAGLNEFKSFLGAVQPTDVS